MSTRHDVRHPNAKPTLGSRGVLATVFGGRVDALTSAVLVFPLFLTYQLGILLGKGQNGVDFVTRALVELSRESLENYLYILGGMMLAYLATLIVLKRRNAFDPRAFVPTILESSAYALIMGSLIVFVMREVLGVSPGLNVPAGPASTDILVISAGAGFHEELVFRVCLMGGLAWLLAGLMGPRQAWIVALLASSLLFSAAHHLGASGEPFAVPAFVYRTLAGMFFGVVYRLRGFAVVAWTHAIYDVYVLTLG